MQCPSVSLTGRISSRHAAKPAPVCTSTRPVVRRPACVSKPLYRTPISFGRELRLQCVSEVQQNGSNGASAPKQTVAYHDGLQVSRLGRSVYPRRQPPFLVNNMTPRFIRRLHILARSPSRRSCALTAERSPSESSVLVPRWACGR
jgi:hypothetical protein